MKYKNVKYHLKRLIADGHKWQNIDVNGKDLVSKFYFSGIQLFFIVIACSSLFLISNGFNNDFIGYMIASLSIFVGLFLTLILSVFDKFQNIDFEKNYISEKERIFLIKKKNFFKQFTALTSYAILISITCIFLLSLSLLSEVFKHNIFEYTFVSSFQDIDIYNIWNFIFTAFMVLYRISIVYFFLDFLLIVIYALTSIYNYITLEYGSKKIN